MERQMKKSEIRKDQIEQHTIEWFNIGELAVSSNEEHKSLFVSNDNRSTFRFFLLSLTNNNVPHSECCSSVSMCGGPEDASETMERSSSSSSSSDSTSLDNSNRVISLLQLGESGGGARYDWSKYTVQPDWQPLLLSSSLAMITFLPLYMLWVLSLLSLSFFFLIE